MDNIKSQPKQADMIFDRSIYRYILTHTLRQQLILIVLTLIMMPVVYYSLEVPKLIIDKVLKTDTTTHWLGFNLSQVEFLVVLSFLYLLLVLLQGLLKYVINVYRGVLGERMLKSFREKLYQSLFYFRPKRFQETSSGAIIPMITSESEPLGGFIGDSIALPVFQGGLLITYLYFIFLQNFWLGLAAIALYPIQMYLIPRLQSKVNALSKERIITVREFSNQINESVEGIEDIQVNYKNQYEVNKANNKLNHIFEIRLDIFKRKFFIKFLNNFLGQLTPFFFYLVGGYFVIKGQVTLGALVAILAAYKDIGPPWKELLKFYQITQDVKVKYQQILDKFIPNIDDDLIANNKLPNSKALSHSNMIAFNNLGIGKDSTLATTSDLLNTTLQTSNHTAIFSANEDETIELCQLLSKLSETESGEINYDSYAIKEISPQDIADNIGYSSSNSFLFNDTIYNNIMYSVNHRDTERSDIAKATEKKSNTTVSATAPHTQPDTSSETIAGGDQSAELLKLCDDFDIGNELLNYGLEMSFDTNHENRLANARYQELALVLLKIRHDLPTLLQENSLNESIEYFDQHSYHENSSIGDNLLFGSHPSIDITTYLQQKWSLQILDAQTLHTDLQNIGHHICEFLLSISEDNDLTNDFLDKHQLCTTTELESFKQWRDSTKTKHIKAYKSLLFKIALNYNDSEHNLGLLEQATKQKLLAARKQLVAHDNSSSLQFYHSERINSQLSIMDNILFGKLHRRKRYLLPKIQQCIISALQQYEATPQIKAFGMSKVVGNAGKLIPSTLRQKIVLIRSMVKDPTILIVNNTLAALDQDKQRQTLASLQRVRKTKNLLCVVRERQHLNNFDQVLYLNNWQVEYHGDVAGFDAAVQHNA